eukprot:13001999-Heterocapsa_arctica.AAC.1
MEVYGQSEQRICLNLRINPWKSSQRKKLEGWSIYWFMAKLKELMDGVLQNSDSYPERIYKDWPIC